MARHDEGFFSANDNLRLFWESLRPDGEARAHVAVVHGYQDHVGRFRATFEALAADGLWVHGFDFRGHGQSDGRRGFCDSFSQYVDDLGLFLDRVRTAASGKKVFLLAHSFGGLVGVHWLSQHPGDSVASAILSSPFLAFGFVPPRLKVLVARAVAPVLPWLPISSPLDVESLSHDVEVQRATERDPLYNRIATPRWFLECLRAQREALSLGVRLELPTFLLYGAEDTVSSPAVCRQFFETVAAGDKKLKEYPGMRHETMNEVGKEEVLGDIRNWISSHL